MWDIEEDWSEDETLELVNKLKSKKSKLKHFEEIGNLSKNVRSHSKPNKKYGNEFKENYELNSKSCNDLNRMFDSMKNIDVSILEEKHKNNQLDSKMTNDILLNVNFDLNEPFNMFGMNSIKYLENKSKNKKNVSNKIFTDVTHFKDYNKDLLKFSGVIDPSRSFFIESWDKDEIQTSLNEFLNSKNDSVIEDNYDLTEKKIYEYEFENYNEKILYEDSFKESDRYVHRTILTNKYIPKTCLDLVNDENSIRNILRWIKQWENCVFKSNNRVKDFQINLEDKNEKFFAPEIPILLVSGPSGCGKSCMVKILSRQCGYEINEIRVSEERTTENFENSIKMRINYNTINNTKRPNLILIDELESISMNNSIKKTDCLDFLVKLIDNHIKNRDLVNRPIICICNDIHDKSLRSLRMKAFNVAVKYPPKEKIFKRLSFICKNEGIKLEDQEILNELIKIHSNDIRSCLNSIYLMSQKKIDLSPNSRKHSVTIYWDDLESCCYTKDVEQEISNFVKTCFGFETDLKKHEIFNYVLEYGEESLVNFGYNLIGLLSENIYRCNLMSDFYFDYLKFILDSIVEYNVLSSKIYSTIPFLYSSILISPKIIGLYCNQFRYLGSSTFVYSKQIHDINKTIYKDISTLTIDALKMETLTKNFKVYTLPSILNHFNYSGYSKYFNLWKSTKIIPKLKSLILKSNHESISNEEFEAISILQKIVTKMVCYGLKFEEINYNSIETNKQDLNHLKPNIESLYSFQCLTNSVNTGYIRNPTIKNMVPQNFIYDVSFYTLVNQLIDFLKEDIIKYIKKSEYVNKKANNIHYNDINSANEKTVINKLISVPDYDQLILALKVKDQCEKSNYYCIYQYNDGCTDAVKMKIQLSDFYS